MLSLISGGTRWRWPRIKEITPDFFGQAICRVLSLATTAGAIALGLFFAFTISEASAAALHKRALLIANSAYKEGPLKSPSNDARALADRLRSQGFQVEVETDLDKFSMSEAIRVFAESLQSDDAAFFYFSGYGLSSVGETFLLPADAQIAGDKDIWRDGVSVKTILKRLDRNSPAAVVVVIDAARRYPPERRFRTEPAGLEPNIGTANTLTIYSASPGQVFDDGGDVNSLFGRELVAEIGRSDLDATEAFNRVRLNVTRRSNGAQVPLVTSTLTRPLQFSGGASGSDARAQQPADQAPSRSAMTTPPEPPADTRQLSELQSGQVFKDCDGCPELVIVPSGSFEMGSSLPHQNPPHFVSVPRRLAVGRYEVSFDEWDLCVDEDGCDNRPQDMGWGRGSNPVINVSWADAKRYVTWLTKKTGHVYRLPSEAEWEYAARAGTRSTYWWGSSVGSNRANCAGCNSSREVRPAKVGSYAANPFGLYDTAGNVAEWVEDCWNDSYRGAPANGAPWLDGECSLRVLRGGSFDSNPSQVQSSFRFRYDAYVPYSANGFRVVRELG